jgi:hypothetical protein
MNTLANLQHAFQSFVLDDDRSAEAEIMGTGGLSAAARLAIYGEAYRLRLVEALASNYPRLKQALGPHEFDDLALQYAQAHRSQRPSIRWFGDRIGEFVATRRSNEPWLGELANWEWAIATAFDAPDADPLDPAAFSRIDPERWSELRLVFHPSIQRLNLHWNTAAMFKAFTAERSAPPPANEARTDWLIWRQDLTTLYRSLEADEAAALDLMRAQGCFAEACELLCEWHEPEQVPLRAASYMQRWLHDGLICAAE